ncbi:MAG: hypothetical protein U0Z26_17675 [Anaerolineales bacterium]
MMAKTSIIADNGFNTDPNLEVGNLLAANHFGLAGMTERAYLIGAEIRIYTTAETGAMVHVTWTA